VTVLKIKQRVEWLLKNYHEIKRHLDRLNYEIKRFTGLSYEQVIETMNYAAPEGERVQTSNISDKSGRLALSYRDYADQLNSDVMELAKEYHAQKDEMDVLDYCIQLLEPSLSEIITDMYINRMTWSRLCSKYHISEKTLARYRKNGIAQITKTFEVRLVR
jgi:hypothetical protein